MIRDIEEVLREHLELPEKFMIYENCNGIKKSRLVTVDREHYIDWISKRVSVKVVWDWTLRMIESYFDRYSKDKNVIKYYCTKLKR